MNKYLYAGFSALLLALSVLAASGTNADLQHFINTNHTLAYSRIGLASMLLLYCLFSHLRQPAVRYLMRGIGTALIVVGIIGISSPTYVGLLDTYVLPADLFIALQGGITALLAGIELNPSPRISARRSVAVYDANDWIHHETEKLSAISTAPAGFVTKLHTRPRRLGVVARQLSKS